MARKVVAVVSKIAEADHHTSDLHTQKTKNKAVSILKGNTLVLYSLALTPGGAKWCLTLSVIDQMFPIF